LSHTSFKTCSNSFPPRRSGIKGQRLIRRCKYRTTGSVLVLGVTYKPQGDPKPLVMSLHGTLLPIIAERCKTHHQCEYALILQSDQTPRNSLSRFQNIRHKCHKYFCANLHFMKFCKRKACTVGEKRDLASSAKLLTKACHATCLKHGVLQLAIIHYVDLFKHNYIAAMREMVSLERADIVDQNQRLCPNYVVCVNYRPISHSISKQRRL